jgi:transcriptional regulator with XRE-family HTH domain
VDKKATFSDRLKAWREKTGLSQEEAAARLDVSRSCISEVENGRPPGRKLVNRLTVEEKPEFDYSTNEGCRKAFFYLAETMPLATLIERVKAIMADESKPIADRLLVANLINPIIERRKAANESQSAETRKVRYGDEGPKEQ